MTDIKKLILKTDVSIRDSIETINQGRAQIALVVDNNNTLIGTVTDGDIRRGLLSGLTLETSVLEIMCEAFISTDQHCTRILAEQIMLRESITQLPILGVDGTVESIFLLNELSADRPLDNTVILMAGGEGNRLKPLTDSCPKPMLPIAGKPLLEIIIEQIIEYGFKNIVISVNYLKDQIMDYFSTGAQWGINIDYLEEPDRLGTAGALSMLSSTPQDAFLVINADVLTKVNFVDVLDFHNQRHASATVCVREHRTQIPYGVVTQDGNTVQSIDEKPLIVHQVNAGVYALSPSTLAFLREGDPCDMTELLERLLNAQHRVVAFPIHEYWLDIGNHASLDQAKGEWLT